MPSLPDAFALALFAKAPVPGRAKTRLSPALGPAGAAALYGAFLADVVATARGLAEADVTIWAGAEDDRPFLEGLGLPLRVQPRADLGRRMETALRAGLERHPRSVVLGTDLPTLPGRLLRDAVAALDGADVVLGPSADGGFYLLGGTHPLHLAGLRWSHRQVLRDTEAAVRRAGRRTARVGPWYDVDVPDDLRLLRMHLALDRQAAPQTRRLLGF